MFSKTELEATYCYKGTVRLLLLTSMKEVVAKITVCTARDHPNVIPQSI